MTDEMYNAIQTLPAQIERAFARAQTSLQGERPRSGPRTLIICGMGGSGIGGALLDATASLQVPVVRCRDYSLPRWATAQDAVVCVSYSGETAETLSAFDDAGERGVPIAAVVTCGGTLGEKAAARNIPEVLISVGMQPRAAVGELYGALLAVAEWLGVAVNAEHTAAEAIAGARGVLDVDAEGLEGSPAREVAGHISGTIPIIYGVGDTVAVAERWKAQINENAKVPAFAGSYPELDHNELVGWQGANTTGACWSLIELEPYQLDARNDHRMTATARLLADDVDYAVRIEAERSRAFGVFAHVAFGDLVSWHLANLRGIDPTPVERIQQLKQQLAGATN